MPKERLSRNYFKRLRKGFGITSVYLSLYRKYQKHLMDQSEPLFQSWHSLLFKSFLKIISDPPAIVASLLPQYTVNFRVVKFWSQYGEFIERLHLGSDLEKTRNRLYRWLDSISGGSEGHPFESV